MVPACRTLDCVSIFASTCDDAHTVWMAARGFDPDDSFSRAPRPGDGAAPWATGSFSFGVPAAGQLEFFGDEEAAQLFAGAIAALESVGGRKVEIDFSVFRAAAALLYGGPWVVERYAALHGFLDSHAGELDPVVRSILETAPKLHGRGLFCGAIPAARICGVRRRTSGSAST